MVFVYPSGMKQKKQENEHVIPISEFKAKCLKLLDETGQQGREYTITKKGEPIAQVVPIRKQPRKSLRGSLVGKAEIHGDIVNFDTSEEWDLYKS